MKFGLSDGTINRINSVFQKYTEIDKVLIYGSRANGNFKEGSDVDLTIIGDSVNESIRKNVCHDIDNLNTPYLFDISVFPSLTSADLIEHINRVGKIFYSKAN